MKCVVASTMAFARFAGSPLLKMPLPTKTPSQPSCIISAASAGVAMPPAEKLTTGSLPFSATHLTSSYGACRSFAAAKSCSGRRPPRCAISIGHRAHVAHRLDHVARARLALRAHHRGAFGDAPERLAQVAAPANERHREVPLVDVVLLVGGREHLGLVDVVDAERLQYLRLDEMPDAALRHHRDGHGGDDRLHDRGVRHARDAAGGADVGRDALERHDRHGAGVLGDLRLFGRHDVHDDAALEHLRQTRLHTEGPGRRRTVAHRSIHSLSTPCIVRARGAGRELPPRIRQSSSRLCRQQPMRRCGCARNG